MNVSICNSVLLALAALVLCAGAAPVLAAGPDLMNYSGFLRDDMGNPVSGNGDLVFRIYDAEAGGSLLWTEDHGPVPVTDGVFSVVLGSLQAMGETLFDGDRWIETEVDGEIMVPRRQFLSTPYAMRATVADVALSSEADTDWTISEPDIYRGSGNVGIGEADPLRRLHIATGSLGLQDADLSGNVDVIVESRDAVLSLYSDGGGQNGSAIGLVEFESGNFTDAWTMRRDTAGSNSELHFIYSDGVTSGTKMLIEPGGDVGIGVTSPSAKLDVLGDVEADHFTARRNLGEISSPELGTTYRDNVVYAWAHVRGDGAILSSYGVDAVTRTGAGRYEVRLQTTLPDGVCATATAESPNDPVLVTASTSTDRVDVVTWLFIPGNHNFSAFDYGFFIQVTGRP